MSTKCLNNSVWPKRYEYRLTASWIFMNSSIISACHRWIPADPRFVHFLSLLRQFSFRSFPPMPFTCRRCWWARVCLSFLLQTRTRVQSGLHWKLGHQPKITYGFEFVIVFPLKTLILTHRYILLEFFFFSGFTWLRDEEGSVGSNLLKARRHEPVWKECYLGSHRLKRPLPSVLACFVAVQMILCQISRMLRTRMTNLLVVSV